jgi:hypothetical protein
MMRETWMRSGALTSLLLLLIGCQSDQSANAPRGIDAPYAYCAATYDQTSEDFAHCWRRQIGRGNDDCKVLLDSASKPGATHHEKLSIYVRMRELQC